MLGLGSAVKNKTAKGSNGNQPAGQLVGESAACSKPQNHSRKENGNKYDNRYRFRQWNPSVSKEFFIL